MSSEHHPTTEWRSERQPIETPLFTDAETALHKTRDIVGRKWHPVLLYYLLQDGPLGFNELKERTDSISSKMLSESLTDLEDAELVTRELLNDQPLRVEYAISEQGQALGPVIEEMINWGIQEDN